MASKVTVKLIRRLCPYEKLAIVNDVVTFFNLYAEQYGLTTDLRIAHFFAQATVETDGFATLEEYASGAEYEGRADLGNIYPNDGVRFKGRGIFQLTGRDNYIRLGQILGIDLVGNPSLAMSGKWAVLTALEYWKSHGLNELADADNITEITRRVNGGYNGFQARKDYLAGMKKLLSQDLDAWAIGDSGPEVKAFQEKLTGLGYKLGICDGDFGPATEKAVRMFQKDYNLEPSGVIDEKTAGAFNFCVKAP